MCNSNRCCRDDEGISSSEEEQRHVHEFEESVKLAEEDEDRHNHRTAGVTGEAIWVGGGRHVHRVNTRTDFLDHFHEIHVTTGIDIPIPVELINMYMLLVDVLQEMTDIAMNFYSLHRLRLL